MKVLIVVTHLLGTGHLARALNLARAFMSAGHQVRVVSGGTPVPQLDLGDVPLVQLAPLRSDGVNFTRLLTPYGTPADECYLAQRQADLVAQVDSFAPDVLITELFPFGRRVLRKEFTALLNAAQTLPHGPVICASVRDILTPPSKPEKAAKTETLLTTYYDAVLVHADQKVTPLDLSWPVSNNLRPMLHYTGFVAPPPAAAHPEKAGQGEIIVTAGGGDVGAHIFDAAIAAAAQSDLTWRILLGGADAGRRATELASVTTSNVILEPARSDFRQMLHHAAACVAMCGYNTALDLLQTGCPAVLIPFDAGGEVEQGIRANALANLPGFDVLKAVELTPEGLLSAIASVCQSAPRTPALEGFDGAVQTVRIVERLEAKRK